MRKNFVPKKIVIQEEIMNIIEKIRRKIQASATPQNTITAIILYLTSILVLTMSDARLTAIAPDFTKPDLTFGYGFSDIILSLSLLGEAGRSAYGTNLIIDSIMPIFFAAATILVIARAAPRWWVLLSVAPSTFMILDIIENTSFGLMLLQFPEVSPGLVAFTSPVTMVKLASFVIALPTLIIGGAYLFIRWVWSKREPSRTASIPE
jgi:hypothetical protein